MADFFLEQTVNVTSVCSPKNPLKCAVHVMSARLSGFLVSLMILKPYIIDNNKSILNNQVFPNVKHW